MYELINVGKETYYFSSPSKIGLWINGNDAYFIDSGNNKDAAKKALKKIDEMGLSLKGVLITHSHADHIGGCNFLQEKTGCEIFSFGIEKAFTEYPILEPSFLYGANPPEELRHKFLLASPSKTTDSPFPCSIERINLSGHSFDMTGYKMPDGTVFIGDALASPEGLIKYPFSFLYDVEKYLETLEFLKELDAKIFVPSHAEPCEKIDSLCEINREQVEKNCSTVLELCKNGATCEELLAKVFDRLGLVMTYEQNVLYNSTLRAYLTYLSRLGKIRLEISENKLIFIA